MLTDEKIIMAEMSIMDRIKRCNINFRQSCGVSPVLFDGSSFFTYISHNPTSKCAFSFDSTHIQHTLFDQD